MFFRCPIETITDYIDNLALLANTSAFVESLLHSLEQAAGCIGLCMNANKINSVGFKQKGTISTLSDKPLKFISQFIYLSSNISSIEIDVSICLAKAWNAIDRLWIIWKSYLSDEIKQNFFEAVALSMLLYGGTTWMLTKHNREKGRWELHKNATSCFE